MENNFCKALRKMIEWYGLDAALESIQTSINDGDETIDELTESMETDMSYAADNQD